MLLCREWPYDEPAAQTAGKPARPFGLRAGQPKGHKWQKEKAAHDAKVEKSLQDMPTKIAAYRVRLTSIGCDRDRVTCIAQGLVVGQIHHSKPYAPGLVRPSTFLQAAFDRNSVQAAREASAYASAALGSIAHDAQHAMMESQDPACDPPRPQERPCRPTAAALLSGLGYRSQGSYVHLPSSNS